MMLSPEVLSVLVSIMVVAPIVGNAAIAVCRALEWERAARVLEALVPGALSAVAAALRKGGPPLVVLLLATGCGAGQDVARYAEATRDVLEVAEPCLMEAKLRDVDACAGEPMCEATVQAHWEPVAVALDVVHAAWCSLSPNSEGCAR